MVYIIRSDKRKKTKFIDKLLESAEAVRQRAKESEREVKRRNESIVDRIKNDVRMQSEEKERLIQSTKPIPLTSEMIKNMKIVSKLDESQVKDVINKSSCPVNYWNVDIEEKGIKEILKRNEE